MSTSVTIHVGPYAEALVPKDQAVNHQRRDDAIESGGLNHNLENQETVTRAWRPNWTCRSAEGDRVIARPGMLIEVEMRDNYPEPPSVSGPTWTRTRNRGIMSHT